MKYKLTLWFEENINELLDILEKHGIEYTLEEAKESEE